MRPQVEEGHTVTTRSEPVAPLTAAVVVAAVGLLAVWIAYGPGRLPDATVLTLLRSA